MLTKQQFSHRKSYLLQSSVRILEKAERFLGETPVRTLTAPQRASLYRLGRRLKQNHDECELLQHTLPSYEFRRPQKMREELQDIQSQIVTLWRRMSDYADYALLPRFPQLPEYLLESRPEKKEKPTAPATDPMSDLLDIMKE